MGEKQMKKLLAKELRTNRVMWAQLQSMGVKDGVVRPLDFSFNAPDEQHAISLASEIQESTGYRVTTASSGGGLLRRARWTVDGTTDGTLLSQTSLDEWVTRMVKLGCEHDCEFDGWGTFAEP